MFAGSCIGVILLVCSLEFIRRLVREYDRHITTGKTLSLTHTSTHHEAYRPNPGNGLNSITGKPVANIAALRSSSSSNQDENHHAPPSARVQRRTGRPTLLQQVVRAFLHMVQFAVAYMVMLLAMYYNGYFIICILIGAFIGAFVFSWDLGVTSFEEEVTGCCG